MKRFYELIVVIPVGPHTPVAFITDTINSFIHYTGASFKIIIADDSQQGIGHEIKNILPDVDLVFTPKPLGGMCGLYLNLSMAFRKAIEKYHFNALFKIDTDALIIGPHPEKEALELFKNDPNIAIAGQYPLDYEGNTWDINWPRRRILNATRSWKYIKRPVANWILGKLYNEALKNGYNTGESVFGGAYFMSEAFVISLYRSGLLPNFKLKTLNLEEDHLFSLLAKAKGFDLASLSLNDLPFGMAWKGLPAPPQMLLLDGKKIIHSTRSWKGMNEEQIRDYFKNIRNGLEVL